MGEISRIDPEGTHRPYRPYWEEGLPEVMAFVGEDVPASVLVGVAVPAGPRFLVEIQATAVL